MSQADLLKHLSNALFVAAAIVLVFAVINGSDLLYGIAAFLFVDSYVMTALKRRLFRQRKAARAKP